MQQAAFGGISRHREFGNQKLQRLIGAVRFLIQPCLGKDALDPAAPRRHAQNIGNLPGGLLQEGVAEFRFDRRESHQRRNEIERDIGVMGLVVELAITEDRLARQAVLEHEGGGIAKKTEGLRSSRRAGQDGPGAVQGGGAGEQALRGAGEGRASQEETRFGREGAGGM